MQYDICNFTWISNRALNVIEICILKFHIYRENFKMIKLMFEDALRLVNEQLKMTEF